MSSKAERLRLIKKFIDENATPEDIVNQSTLCKLVAKKEGDTPEEKLAIWNECMRTPRSPEEILSFRYPDVKKKKEK